METEDLLGRRIGLLHQAVEPKHEHAGRKIGQHCLAKVFRGAGAVLFGESLYLEFVLLLFELLDDGVIEVEGKSFKAGRGAGL